MSKPFGAAGREVPETADTTLKPLTVSVCDDSGFTPRGLGSGCGLRYTASMKRMLGAVAWLLMLHLTLAGSDLVCAKHGHMDGMQQNGRHLAQTAHSDGAPHTEGAPAENCPTPAKQDCCAALAACTINIAAVASITREERPASARSVHLERAAYAPLIVSAPEPPPPRA